MSVRKLWLALPLALFSACASTADDAADPGGPLDAVPDALSGSALGPSDKPGSSTEVWAVQNQWSDRDTTAAKAKGLGWEADSGLTWEQKYGKWLGSLEKIRNAADSDDTLAIVTPYGKTVPAPALECAETAMALRRNI